MDIRQLLVGRGCLYPYDPAAPTRHFVGTSDKHLGGYGCLDPILCDPVVTWRLTGMFADAFGVGGQYFNPDAWPELVVVPAVGEIAMVQPLATQLINVLPTPYVGAIWADKMPVPLGAPTKYKIVRPTYPQQVRGRRVLVAVDFINSMYTASALIDEVRLLGGTVVGVCAIVYNTATGVSAELLGVPAFYGLCPFDYPVWTPEDCQAAGLCAREVPIVVDDALGHGAKFRDEHPELPASRFVTLLAA